MQQKRTLRKPVFIKVKDIEPTMRLNVYVCVDSIENELEIKKLDGESMKICTCLVGDETGVVQLKLKDKQVQFAKPNESLILRNVRANVFKGHIRLEADIWAKIEKAEVNIQKIKCLS
jgi:hypothetical protein